MIEKIMRIIQWNKKEAESCKDEAYKAGAMDMANRIKDDIREYCGTSWIPVSEQLPEDSKYILLSFSNFSLPAVGRYEKDDEGGVFYLGDCDEEDTCVANDLFVNAWMPLPEPYKQDN